MGTNPPYTKLTAINFREEVLETRNPVFVEFTADWSGSSHIMAPVIEHMAVKYEGLVKFCKVDVDTCEEIGREYAVQHIPTIVFFKDGQAVDSVTGVVPKRILAQKLNALIGRSDE